ncbi:MAG: hypothetical protein GY713_19270, partial [Actinomycetia bacterium]|nr:hypothetical protein [Actinomycetes bacterium]
MDGLMVAGNAASDDLVIHGLIVTKEFLADPVLPGSEVVLRFTLVNISPAAATILIFRDALDPEVLPGMAATVLPTLPCGPGSALVAVDRPGSPGEELSLTGASLAAAGSPGDSCTFDVTLLVPAATPSDTYTNTTGLILALIGTDVVIPENAIDNLTVSNELLFLTKEFTD